MGRAGTRGRDDRGDDLGGLDREPRVAKRSGERVAGVRRRVRDSRNGRPCSRIHESVSTAPGDRLPRDGEHPVDVEQESVDVHEVQSRIATGRTRLRRGYGTSLIPARLRASSTSCEGSIPF